MGLLSRFTQKQETSDNQDSGEFRSRAEEESIETRSRSKKTETKRRSKVNDPILPEKKRARRRLIGAVALALAAIIGLPMVLDSDPKPLPDDINIRIPSKDKAFDASAASDDAAPKKKNLAVNEIPEEIIDMPMPAKGKPDNADKQTKSTANTGNAALAAQPVTNQAATQATAQAKPVKPEVKAEIKQETKPVVKAEVKPEQKTEVKTVQAPAKPAEKDATVAKNETRSETKQAEKPVKPETKPSVAKLAHVDDEAARAMAILEGKAPPAKPVVAKPEAAEKSSYSVQAGAFSTQSKVDEVQAKLKSANIQSYTQKIITTNGEVTRIRVGPFASKDEADKMRAKLSKLGLNASLPPN